MFFTRSSESFSSWTWLGSSVFTNGLFSKAMIALWLGITRCTIQSFTRGQYSSFIPSFSRICTTHKLNENVMSVNHKTKQQIENVWVYILSIKTLQGVQTAVRKWPNKYEILVIQTLLLINKKFLYCMGLFSDHCMTYKVAGPCCCVRGQDFKIQYFLAKRHLLYLFLLVNFVLYFQMVSPRKRIQSLNNSLNYLS